MLDKVPHEFLHKYLEYVEDTESPRIFHIWSALTTIATCLGRRCYLPFGPSQIFANQYVLLVGPPGVKKSTAVSLASRLLKQATNVRFAPDDMGGQRQGLIKAMEGKSALTEEDVLTNGQLDSAMIGTLDGLEDMKARLDEIQLKVDVRDSHCMFASAGEFNSFIGQNSVDLINFLVKVWDGDDYEYQTKGGEMCLREPLLSILGGTTPTNIVKGLPPEAIGQGFMSRIILVHGNKPYKDVDWPDELDGEKAKELLTTYNYLFYTFDGEIGISPDAKRFVKSLYKYNPDIQDTRFVYYQQRRQAHLLKLSINLAACDRRNVIEKFDVEAAHEILKATEITMPDALGEFGLSPLAQAKQKMMEFIQNCRSPVSTTVLFAVMNKDMRKVDFLNSLTDLCNSGKILQLTLPSGDPGYVYRDDKTELALKLDAFLGEERKGSEETVQ